MPEFLPVKFARLCVLACVCALAAPAFAAKPAKPAKPDQRDVLGEAQACYGAGDLACVLRVLSEGTVAPAQEAEKFRMLAFAAARLDQHEAARRYFGAWLKLSPQNRLERATTTPNVYQDYTAALLAAQSGALDWTPEVENHPALAPLGVTPTDLPGFAPPPRMPSEVAKRMSYLLGVHASLPTNTQWGPAWAHFGIAMAIELDLPYALRAGVAVGGWDRPDISGGDHWNPYLLARFGVGKRWGDSGVDLLLGGGVAFDNSDSGVVGAFAPAVRYHWRPAERVVGGYLEVSSQTLFGSAQTIEVIGVSLGVILRPNR